LFVSGIHPKDPDRVWFRVPGRGDVYGLLPARLWVTTDGATTFTEVAAFPTGMLGFALSPDGNRMAFGGPTEGLFTAPTDNSAAPSKVSDLQVSCLRWVSSGLYVCANEPKDPFSLGVATDPAQGFIPLWHRADACELTCPPSSRITQTCKQAREMIVPLLGGQVNQCNADLVLPDAGTVVESRAPSLALDGGPPLDASPVESAPTSTARARPGGGCALTLPDTVGTAPCWLCLFVVLACRRRR
jgi:hypothetical protein